MLRKRLLSVVVLALSLPLRATLAQDPAAAAARPDPALLPEPERAFFQDGPALLLPAAERDRLLALPAADRAAAVAAFLAQDPDPATPGNQLVAAIARRQALVVAHGLWPLDDRSRILFLHGEPAAVDKVDCGETYQPIELWKYPPAAGLPTLVLYRPESAAAWRLWLPLDSKRVLYNAEMEYWLEQWEELRGRIRGRRFDREICEKAKAVDEATGVDGLRDFRDGRPTQQQLEAALLPPADLAAWTREALATPIAEEKPALPLGDVVVQFPEARGQRIVAREFVQIPASANLQPFVEGELREIRITVDGHLEGAGRNFEDFSVRYRIPAPPAGAAAAPIVLAVDRPLRPKETFVLRLRVRDEVSGRETRIARGFQVPAAPIPVAEPPVAPDAVLVTGEALAAKRIPGRDSLVLVPPEGDVVIGLWRAEALVTGERIAKVVFTVDGKEQLTRGKAPFTAELRLSRFPVEQVVTATGYDAAGAVVASDEVVINQPRGALKVRILEPPRGKAVHGTIPVRLEIVVPDERRVTKVELRLNNELVTTLEAPPWATTVKVPETEETTYLAANAFLDDGQQAEDVRFLNAPENLEEVNVDLVELLTTVTGRDGRPVKGLAESDFEVLEDGAPQRLARFETVDDLPLQLGVVLDTSGSMEKSLGEAETAAQQFLQSVMTPRDKAFVMTFADRPSMAVPPTGDMTALVESLRGLQAYGSTSLHDSLMTGLYYFRGMHGRRAIVLLSDGDDTSSATPWRDALEYAKRSGVAIYTIGLRIGALDMGIRNKLKDLSESTGGRVFFVDSAAELAGTYKEIEQELRSQYLLAYGSDSTKPAGQFRKVEVRMKKSGLTARTMGGYWP